MAASLKRSGRVVWWRRPAPPSSFKGKRDHTPTINSCPSSPHNGDSEAIQAILVERGDDGEQAWIARYAAVVLAERAIVLVGRILAQRTAAADAVVRDDDGAGTGQLQRPIEVAWVARLVGVDENQIKRRLTLQRGQQL